MRQSLFGVYHPTHKLALLLSDLLSIAFAFFLATYLRLDTIPNFLSLEYIGLNAIIVSCLFLGNGYTSGVLGRAPRLPLNTLFIILASVVPSTLYIYLLGPERFTALFGRGVFPFAIIVLGFLGVANRYLLNLLFRGQQKNRQILVLGSVKAKARFDQSISAMQLNMDIQHVSEFVSGTPPQEIDAIVITPDHSPSKFEQQALISYRLAGIPIFSLSDFFESFSFLVPVQEINNDWFIRAEGFTMLHSSVAVRVKRAFDVITAFALLILTSPIMLLTALLIKLTSRGPIFFSQTRVGIEGKPFTLYKFRTMKNGAEDGGAQWACDNDSRILPVGHFLRKTRIDELPQCWNILRGEMSIVGPRPERPEFTSMLAEQIPYYDLRNVIKPGLTGWAQVCYPYGASTEDALRKLQYDLYYIKNYSLLLDLNILLRTVLVTLRRGGR